MRHFLPLASRRLTGCMGVAPVPGALVAPTRRAHRACGTHSRSSAGPGRTSSRGRRPAGTRAGRTPRSAAPPRGSCARRLLAPRPGVRYLWLTGPPHSHTRARRLRKALQRLLKGLSSSWARAAPNSTGRTADAQLFGHGPGAMPFGGRKLQATGPKTLASWRPSTACPPIRVAVPCHSLQPPPRPRPSCDRGPQCRKGLTCPPYRGWTGGKAGGRGGARPSRPSCGAPGLPLLLTAEENGDLQSALGYLLSLHA